jgi:hypothetical protein
VSQIVSTPWCMSYWWQWIDGSCHDWTERVISLYCKMLQETERPSFVPLCCCMLIYDVAAWYRLLSIVTNPPWYIVHCYRINQSFKPYAAKSCVSPSEWFHQYVHCRLCWQGASWSTLSYVTLSWPDANVWYHLTPCCLNITSLPYTFMNCQRISDTDTLYPQKAYKSSEFKARPVFQVGCYVKLMHLCSLLTCALNFMTQPKHSSLLFSFHFISLFHRACFTYSLLIYPTTALYLEHN